MEGKAGTLRHGRLTTSYPANHIGGAREDRTPDLLRARQALSQLSYGPLVQGTDISNRMTDLKVPLRGLLCLLITGLCLLIGGSGWI